MADNATDVVDDNELRLLLVMDNVDAVVVGDDKVVVVVGVVVVVVVKVEDPIDNTDVEEVLLVELAE